MTNKYNKAIKHELGVEDDMTTMCKWVRENLFYVMIHDLKEDRKSMSEDGAPCENFVGYFLENRSLLVNPEIEGANEEDLEKYLKHLWNKGLSNDIKGKLNIRKNLSLEKTAVYAAISEAFKSLILDCIATKVPFPAYETFEDRKNLPRRYFLFFDRFFQAGRHNKELWEAAITLNNGRNRIQFGTCIFEAHVRTTIQENYFTWLYQALSSPMVVTNLQKASDFKMEYDDDAELDGMLACNCPHVTNLPISSEYRYNEKSKKYETLTCFNKTEIDEVRRAERDCLRNLIYERKGQHKETLEELRKMVDEKRPLYSGFSRQEKNEFNLEAKKRFRLFNEQTEDKENELPMTVEVLTPARKKQKRTLSSQKKCRVSNEKLVALAAVKEQLLVESSIGLRDAWDNLYKKIALDWVANNADEQEENMVKQVDLFGELNQSKINWKSQLASVVPTSVWPEEEEQSPSPEDGLSEE